METLEKLCEIAGEDIQKAVFIGNFIKQALFDEHEEMRNQAIKILKQETIAGYKVIKSLEADNEVLIYLNQNKSEDPRLTNPQLIPLRTIEDYKDKTIYHFKIE